MIRQRHPHQRTLCKKAFAEYMQALQVSKCLEYGLDPDDYEPWAQGQSLRRIAKAALKKSADAQ